MVNVGRLQFVRNVFNNMGNREVSLEDIKKVLVSHEQLFGRNRKEIKTIENSSAALDFITEAAIEGRELNVDFILDLHKVLLDGISNSCGKYRDMNVKNYACGVYDCRKVETQLNQFIKNYNKYAKKYSPIYLAAYVHLEMIRIRPFNDGNCRVATLLMNYILMSNGLNSVTISDEHRDMYYYFTQLYTNRKTIQPMVDLIYLSLKGGVKHA